MAVPASEAEAPHERARILVVEDEPVIRLYIAEALRDMGALVIEAGTADEAWAFLATGAEVDLVFTDHRMPGSMTGSELATRIRGTYPGLAVLLTSGVLDMREWPEPIIEKPYGVIATAVSLIRRARNARNQDSGARDQAAGDEPGTGPHGTDPTCSGRHGKSQSGKTGSGRIGEDGDEDPIR